MHGDRATRWRQRLRRMHDRLVLPLFDAVLPADCFACERPLGARQRLGACATCWAEFTLLAPPLCPGCALPQPPVADPAGPARGRCASCVGLEPACEAIQAVHEYDDHARRFLLRAKLGRRPELLAPLGAQLARVVELTGFAEGATLVVPAPSHPWANLSRGFSPAHELARQVARRLGLPVASALGRSLGTPASWKRLAARERRAAAAAAFRSRRRCDGHHVLLVDDVMTTGSTLEACAAVALRAGARRVRGAVWARASEPRHPEERAGRRRSVV